MSFVLQVEHIRRQRAKQRGCWRHERKEAVRLEDVGGVEPPEEIREEPQSRCVLQPSGLSTCLFCSAGEGSLGLTHVGEGSATELHVRRQDYYTGGRRRKGLELPTVPFQCKFRII